MKDKLRGGFTLIELVVVIVILGILMAIAIPKYVDITGQAKRAADRGQLAGLRASTHKLYAQNILTNGPAPYWPTTNQVWANMQSSNTWQYYTNVVYAQSNGVWNADDTND